MVYVGSGTATVKRAEWGLVWNKPLEQAGGVLVGDDVVLQVDAEYLAKPPAPAAKK
jgi:hypothetical protein